MHCEVIQPELVSFYFGDVEEEARARVDTHLLECRSCLDAYLSLKRSIEAADTCGAQVSSQEQVSRSWRDARSRGSAFRLLILYSTGVPVPASSSCGCLPS